VPIITIELPYTPEAPQIALMLEQQITQAIPGAQVTVTEDPTQQPMPAAPGGPPLGAPPPGLGAPPPGLGAPPPGLGAGGAPPAGTRTMADIVP
jgi:hypothetical protein